MLEQLEARGLAAAKARAARARSDLAARIWAEVPGVTATVEGQAVVIEGRGLMRRWIGDPAFRAIGAGR